MKKKVLLLRGILLFYLVMMSGCAIKIDGQNKSTYKLPDYILNDDEKTINQFLKNHSHLRLALDSDCECDEMISEMNKWLEYKGYKGVSYHPYYVNGDFNFDGNADFAVVCIDSRQTKNNFIIVIFNGPSGSKGLKKMAYISKSLDLKKGGLFYGPPRPKPWVLMYAEEGQTETELDCAFVPKGDTYEYRPIVKYNEDGTVKEIFP